MVDTVVRDVEHVKTDLQRKAGLGGVGSLHLGPVGGEVAVRWGGRHTSARYKPVAVVPDNTVYLKQPYE